MLLFILSFLITAFGQPAFIPFLGPVGALCGYALFWKAILVFPQKNARFWGACLWYAAVQAVQLSWMTSIDYQGIYILFVYAGLAFLLGLQFGFFSLFIKKDNSFLAILALSSLWTLLEWSRFFFLCGFSWNPSGLALSCYQSSMQMASISGVLGLSFWVMFVNLGVLQLFNLPKLGNALSWAAVAFFPYLFGICHLTYHEQAQKKHDKSLTVLLVQTGLMPSQKVPLQGKMNDFISPFEQWKRILEWIKQHENADLIVLPEGAVPCLSGTTVYSLETTTKIFKNLFGESIENSFPKSGNYFFNENRSHVSNCFWAQTLSNHLKTEIIIGLDHIELGKQECYNSALHFRPKNEKFNHYYKRVLLPLAEYLPYKWLYPFVKAYGITEFFTKGKESRVFQGVAPFSASICYEETFPDLIRQGRLNGGQVLVNITNDAWYPHSKLAKQHFYHARLRTVENGAPLLRACNTGITAALDSLGGVIGYLPELDQNGEPFAGVLKIKLKTYQYPTLYTFWGNWFIIIISSSFILFFVLRKKTNN